MNNAKEYRKIDPDYEEKMKQDYSLHTEE